MNRTPARRSAASILSRYASAGLLALTPAAARQAAPHDLATITASIEREIERTLEETKIPSVSLALVRGGSVVWTGARGYANVGARVPATADTYYSTGSTFKLVTATAIMQLVEKGQLTLETPLNAIVGEELAVAGAGDVTVRHLLSHRSGLDAFAFARRLNAEGPKSTVPLWSRRPSITPEELLANTRRVGSPGTDFRYSNDGYAIAGYLVEVVSRRSFDRYVAKNVLRPLGIDVDRPSVPSPSVVEHMALPYVVAGGEPTPVSQVRYDGFAAGDVYLRASDMARFVAAHLNGGEYEGAWILSRASTEEMRRPQFDGRPYGLGVRSANVAGHEVIHHGGSIPGFHAIYVAEPASGHGVYVMANAGNAGDAVGQLAHYALRLMWGESDAPPSKPTTDAVVPVDTDLLDEYAGVYVASPKSTFVFSRDVERFFVQVNGGDRQELFASSATDFFLRTGSATVAFGRDEPSGPVTHLILHKVRGDQRVDKASGSEV